MLKILLFDHHLRWGHHPEYAGHVARYLQEVGDLVLIATSDGLQALTGQQVEEVADVSSLAASGGPQRTGFSPVAVAQGVHRCMRVARQEQVDIVHFLYLDRSELALLASLTLRRWRPRVFGTLFWPYFVHGDGETIQATKRLFHSANRRALERLLSHRLMDGLFVHSERTRSLLLSTFRASVSERIHIVPDPAKEAPDMSVEDARLALGLPRDVPMILFFGGARFDKGPDILLEALLRLSGDWLAVMAGSAGFVGAQEAENCRRFLQDPKRLITRFELIPEQDADRYFRAADVIVLPYRSCFKGTSGVLQRAAASGKPVVASDVGDVGGTVRQAGLGVVVRSEDPQALAEGLQGFLGRRAHVTREVEPRALAYANANDWRVLGKEVRAKYLRAVVPRG
jgi:glycosyltransferase involved in cell wall biosynthesis